MNYLKKMALVVALVAGLCGGAWARDLGHRGGAFRGGHPAYRVAPNYAYRGNWGYPYRGGVWGTYPYRYGYYPYNYGYYPYNAYGYYPYNYNLYPYGYGYYPYAGYASPGVGFGLWIR